jgi:hypothetical protein
LVSGIWHQSHEAGEFDGVGNHPLMLGAKDIASGGTDFKLSGHVGTQKLGVLVVNVTYIVFTKFTVHNDVSQRG